MEEKARNADRPALATAYARTTIQHARNQADMGNLCVRGLNTETGAISPDRGNHAIKVTRPGRMRPAIPRPVRHLVRYLACT